MLCGIINENRFNLHQIIITLDIETAWKIPEAHECLMPRGMFFFIRSSVVEEELSVNRSVRDGIEG